LALVAASTGQKTTGVLAVAEPRPLGRESRVRAAPWRARFPEAGLLR
jgi:hypothetical protein